MVHSVQVMYFQSKIIQGPDSIQRWRVTSTGNPIVKIRWSSDRLTYTMRFPIVVRRHLSIKSGPTIPKLRVENNLYMYLHGHPTLQTSKSLLCGKWWRSYGASSGPSSLGHHLGNCIFLMMIVWYSFHYNDVILSAMASQITSLMTVNQTVYSGADKKNQSSASLAFVRGIHRWRVNSPHKGPVTRKMLPFHDGIMDTWFSTLGQVHADLQVTN